MAKDEAAGHKEALIGLLKHVRALLTTRIAKIA
jgi:hypothetical protein